MSSPLQVNPGDIEITASSLQELTADLGGAIPADTPVTVFPSGAASAMIHRNSALATALMQQRVDATSAKLAATGQQYHAIDQQNAGKLGGGVGEAIKLGEVGQILGPIFAPLQSMLQAAAQLGQAWTGVVGSAVGELMNPLTGVAGAGVSAHATMASKTAPAGPGPAAQGLLGTGDEHEHVINQPPPPVNQPAPHGLRGR